MFTFAIAKLIAGEIVESQRLLNLTMSSQSSMDESFSMSQPPFFLKGLEVSFSAFNQFLIKFYFFASL